MKNRNLGVLCVILFFFCQNSKGELIQVKDEWNLISLDIGWMDKNKFDMGLFPVFAIHKTGAKDIWINIEPISGPNHTWEFRFKLCYLNKETNKLEVLLEKILNEDFKQREGGGAFTGFPEDYSQELRQPVAVKESSIPILHNKSFVVKMVLTSAGSEKGLTDYAPIALSYCGTEGKFRYRFMDL